MKLGNLGERRIIADLLYPRYSGAEGIRYWEDCALLEVDGGCLLAVTTDPCPRPMAAILGETDLYYYGWLLGTINLSDLAAVGAHPLGLLTSLTAPASMAVGDFERLLDGIDAVCRRCDTRVIGGNIKEGPELQCSGTAIGLCERGKELRRSGARPGDLLLAVGDLGEFWAYALNRLRRLGVPESSLERGRSNALTPVPKIREATAIASVARATACMDNSDGLYACAKELALINRCSVVIDFAKVHFSPGVNEVARRLGVTPHRLALGWGDWQLVLTVAPDDLGAISSAVSEIEGSAVYVVGRLAEGPPTVLQAQDGRIGELRPVDSERFTADSWFSAGIEIYIAQLLGE
jgi:thiamine-monophosphate kinase